MHVVTTGQTKKSLIEATRSKFGQFMPVLRGQEDVFFYPLIALVLAYAFMNAPVIHLGELVENLTVDMRFHARARFDPPANDKLVILGIDAQSIENIGRWPWDRSFFSGLMNLMAANDMQPKALVYDVVFSDPTVTVDKNNKRLVDRDKDQGLADAASQLPVVITGALLDKLQDAQLRQAAEAKTKAALTGPLQTAPITQINGDINQISEENSSNAANLPVEQLRNTSYFGFVDANPSPLDGIRWTLPLVVRLQGKLYPSLALETVILVMHIDPENVIVNVGQNVTLINHSGKKTVIPTTPSGEIWVNYRKDETFQALSILGFAQNLAAHQETNAPLAKEFDLKQKIVLIGANGGRFGGYRAQSHLGPNAPGLHPHEHH